MSTLNAKEQVVEVQPPQRGKVVRINLAHVPVAVLCEVIKRWRERQKNGQ